MEIVYMGIISKIFNAIFNSILAPIFKFLSSLLSTVLSWLFDSVLKPLLINVLEPLFTSLLKLVVEILASIIYSIYASCLQLVDALQSAFNIFAGLESVTYQTKEMSEPVKASLLEVLFRLDTVQKAIWAMACVAFVLLMMFSVLGTLRSMSDIDGENQRPVSKVLSGMLRGFLRLILIPLASLFAILMAGYILKGIDQALDSEDSSLARMVFVVSSLDACKTDGYNISSPGTGIEIGIHDAKREPFYKGTTSYTNKDKVSEVFDLGKFDYFIGFGGALFLIIVLAICLITFICRIFDVLLLLLAAPFFAAVTPLDDGQKFSSWQDMFVAKLFGGYGTVTAMELYMMLCPSVMDGNITFGQGSTEANYLIRLIFLLGGAWAVVKAGPTITQLLNFQAGGMEADTARSTVDYLKGAAGTMGTAVMSAGSKAGQAYKGWRSNKDEALHESDVRISNRLGWETDAAGNRTGNRLSGFGEGSPGLPGSTGTGSTAASAGSESRSTAAPTTGSESRITAASAGSESRSTAASTESESRNTAASTESESRNTAASTESESRSTAASTESESRSTAASTESNARTGGGAVPTEGRTETEDAAPSEDRAETNDSDAAFTEDETRPAAESQPGTEQNRSAEVPASEVPASEAPASEAPVGQESVQSAAELSQPAAEPSHTETGVPAETSGVHESTDQAEPAEGGHESEETRSPAQSESRAEAGETVPAAGDNAGSQNVAANRQRRIASLFGGKITVNASKKGLPYLGFDFGKKFRFGLNKDGTFSVRFMGLGWRVGKDGKVNKVSIPFIRWKRYEDGKMHVSRFKIPLTGVRCKRYELVKRDENGTVVSSTNLGGTGEHGNFYLSDSWWGSYKGRYDADTGKVEKLHGLITRREKNANGEYVMTHASLLGTRIEFEKQADGSYNWAHRTGNFTESTYFHENGKLRTEKMTGMRNYERDADGNQTRRDRYIFQRKSNEGREES